MHTLTLPYVACRWQKKIKGRLPMKRGPTLWELRQEEKDRRDAARRVFPWRDPRTGDVETLEQHMAKLRDAYIFHHTGKVPD